MIIDCAVYEDGRRLDGIDSVDDVVALGPAPHRFAWIVLHEPSAAELADLSPHFGIHELVVEDAIEARQRPKLEVDGDQMFAVLRTAWYDDTSESVSFAEIRIITGPDVAVVVEHGESAALDAVRQDLESQPDQLSIGPAAVLHAVIDQVVDDYVPVMEGIDDDIAEVEARLFSDDRANPVERIYALQRQVLAVHRALAPLIEPLAHLAQRPVPTVPEAARRHFRDVEDHLLRVHDRNELNRELLTNILEVNMTRVSIQQNEDMRKISAWAAVALVPTLIASIYGMNFDHIPALGWRHGYLVVVGLMLVASASLYANFRRRGWI